MTLSRFHTLLRACKAIEPYVTAHCPSDKALDFVEAVEEATRPIDARDPQPITREPRRRITELPTLEIDTPVRFIAGPLRGEYGRVVRTQTLAIAGTWNRLYVRLKKPTTLGYYAVVEVAIIDGLREDEIEVVSNYEYDWDINKCLSGCAEQRMGSAAGLDLDALRETEPNPIGD